LTDSGCTHIFHLAGQNPVVVRLLIPSKSSGCAPCPGREPKSAQGRLLSVILPLDASSCSEGKTVMSNIIPFPVPVADLDECDILNPLASITPDPFPDFKIFSMSSGRAPMEAHVSTALAEAMIKVVKGSPEPCSLEIYKRDESTAWLEGNLPTAVTLSLLEMLAA
jgi:hypothetical protein